MKICIVSDSHDDRRHLEAAAAAARAQGAEAILHCGDVVAPGTLGVLQQFGLPVHVIHGNNAGDVYALTRLAAEKGSVLRFHGQDAGIYLAGRQIFLVHYPHYARAMAATGDWDLVCCGHDHRAAIERLPNMRGATTVLANPGTVGGIGAPPTYILGDLQTMQFDIHELS